MLNKCIFRWGASADHDFRYASFEGIDEFEAAVDMITRSATESSTVYEVGMRRVPPDSRADPVLVQFLIGDHSRSSLLWHRDTGMQVAVDPRLPELSYDLTFERLGGRGIAEPLYTRVAPEMVRQALIVYLLTNRQAEGLDWQEAPDD